ncbi:MAG: ABC-2 family transporter protein [Deltaproteobacteria bacterium]|nr:ABC-2 family transporter protein [Deltaproteobacteria bacterium]
MSVAGSTLRATPSLLKVGFAEMVAYRAEMVVWILTATLPLVALALWNAAAVAGPLEGFGQDEFARYFTVTLVVRQLTSCWIVWELNHYVRTGSLSPMLLRPMHPLFWNLCETLAAIPFRLVVLAPIVGALLWWRPQIAFWPGSEAVLLGTVSVVMAFLLAWVVQALFGMLAFWFEQALGFFNLWFVALAVIGGYVIPLPLLPEGVEAVARWLPFHAALGAPIEVWMETAPDPWSVVGIQALWLLAALLTARVLWRRGVRRYGAVGA